MRLKYCVSFHVKVISTFNIRNLHLNSRQFTFLHITWTPSFNAGLRKQLTHIFCRRLPEESQMLVLVGVQLPLLCPFYSVKLPGNASPTEKGIHQVPALLFRILLSYHQEDNCDRETPKRLLNCMKEETGCSDSDHPWSQPCRESIANDLISPEDRTGRTTSARSEEGEARKDILLICFIPSPLPVPKKPLKLFSRGLIMQIPFCPLPSSNHRYIILKNRLINVSCLFSRI